MSFELVGNVDAGPLLIEAATVAPAQALCPKGCNHLAVHVELEMMDGSKIELLLDADDVAALVDMLTDPRIRRHLEGGGDD